MYSTVYYIENINIQYDLLPFRQPFVPSFLRFQSSCPLLPNPTFPLSSTVLHKFLHISVRSSREESHYLSSFEYLPEISNIIEVWKVRKLTISSLPTPPVKLIIQHRNLNVNLQNIFTKLACQLSLVEYIYSPYSHQEPGMV